MSEEKKAAAKAAEEGKSPEEIEAAAQPSAKGIDQPERSKMVIRPQAKK